MERKILHISEYASGGGAETVFTNTILSLRNSVNNNLKHYVACRILCNESFTVDYPLPPPSKSKFRKKINQMFDLNICKKLVWILNDCKPDVIHIQNYANLSPSIFYAIKNYKKTRRDLIVIHSVHTFEYVCSHHAAYDYRKNKKCLDCKNNIYKYKIFYRLCSRNGILHSFGKGLTSLIASYYINSGLIDSWTAPSDFLKLSMQSNKAVRNIDVIRNPQLNQKNDIPNRAPENEFTFNIVYFGRFSKEKDIELLIKAMSLLKIENKKILLYLIGKGSEQDNIESLIERLNLQEVVIIKDFMEKSDLHNFLKSMHIAVMTSKCYENAPLVIVESIMNNLIPIVSEHGGMLETIELLNFGLSFKAEDIFSLKNSMTLAMDNYVQILNEIAHAKEKINSIYNEKLYCSSIENLYNIKYH